MINSFVDSSKWLPTNAFLYMFRVTAVVYQDYRTEADNEFVILGNAAVVKCEIPSFVADFVRVTGWIDETSGANFLTDNNIGTSL